MTTSTPAHRPSPEKVARVAAIFRPHIPAILAARAAREAAARAAEKSA